jgi:hypothetical protein
MNIFDALLFSLWMLGNLSIVQLIILAYKFGINKHRVIMILYSLLMYICLSFIAYDGIFNNGIQ